MTAPHYEDGRVTIWHGDCLDVLREMPDNSVDAIVTDPPAGIAFMGRTWDGDKGGREQWSAWLAEIMREALRVTKPGGHAFVWALPRTAHWTACGLEDAGWEIRDRVVHLFGTGFRKSKNLGGGFGTALKPAAEDWWLCRKPIEGSTTANFLAHGTGGLNIDGTKTDAGRWPTNVVLDGGDAATELDEQSGNRRGFSGGGATPGEVGNDVYGKGWQRNPEPTTYNDSGGASRFFSTFRYQAKAPTRERPSYIKPDGTKIAHPTVKPLELFRWLTRLVCPPGGVVLDPFAGSGTTIEACLQEGFQVIGIEREADYLPLIKARIDRNPPTLFDPTP